MPLLKGSSSKVIAKNIREFHTGKTFAHTAAKFGKERADKQAVAVALNTARKKKAVGGLAALKIPKPPGPSFYQRDAVRSILKAGAPKGAFGKGKRLFARGGLVEHIESDIPGRTDKHPKDVPAGSYVVPADIISHLGENNTKAGFKKLEEMVENGSFGGRRRARKSRMFATGGSVEPVPIIVAGGEAILHPDAVRDIGNGNVTSGHDRLDSWVLETRKKHINTLKKLSPPQR